ncbi:MAG: DUF3226 domain-containing protein [Pseudomonadota bacterium]
MAYIFIVQPKPGPSQFTREVVIITEGIDDAVFLEAVLEERKEDMGRTEIRYVQGNGGIASFLNGLTLSPGFTQGKVRGIGVIADADENSAEAEKRIQKCFKDAGLPVPDSGRVKVEEQIWCGLFLFPSLGQPGMLEDLVLDVMPQSPVLDMSRGLVDSVVKLGSKLDKMGKRVVQVYLAVCEGKLSRGPGQGVRNGSIPIEHSKLAELNEFLDELLKHR